MSRHSGTDGIVTKDLTFVSLESQKEEKESGAEKVWKEIMAENSQNLAVDIILTDLRT